MVILIASAFREDALVDDCSCCRFCGCRRCDPPCRRASGPNADDDIDDDGATVVDGATKAFADSLSVQERRQMSAVAHGMPAMNFMVLMQ